MEETEKLEQRRREEIESAPSLYRGHYERAFAGVASPRQAIKAMCLRCSNNERKEVTHCRVYECPLREYRPYQGDTDPDDTSAVEKL